MAEIEGPRHVAIILDGNRRWAKQRHLPPWEGHRRGADNIQNLLKYAKNTSIKELTLYSFSVKNFQRDPKEVEFLFDIFRDYFKKFAKSKEIKENEIRIKIAGRKEMFPEDMQKLFKEIEEDTKDYTNYTLNFAMGYDGRAEVIDAAKKIIKEVKAGNLKESDINEETYKQYLYIPEDVDLLIRTSGEFRISGFLIYQGSYAEYYFTKKMWPEFSKEDLDDAINVYLGRERRFGQ